MAPDQLDAMFGWPAGTVRQWIRDCVIAPDPDEHTVITAYVLRPASSGDHRTRAARLAGPDHGNAAWAAAVRASLERATEATCTETTTDVPSAPPAA